MTDHGTGLERSEVARSGGGTNGLARLTWWHAGGLHAHVKYPDGSWSRQTWTADSWWEIDALRFRLQDEGYSVDVRP